MLQMRYDRRAALRQPYPDREAMKATATRTSLRQDLARLGIERNDIVMVHASIRSVGRVLGGVNTIVEALLDAVGTEGTVAVYTDWEDGTEDDDWTNPDLRDEVPAFDKSKSRARRDHGYLPEAIRTWPGAFRSDNPGASVAAIGARAEWLCADHAMQYGYADGSPFRKLIEAGGKVLMLGAPLDTMTLLHHSEHVVPIQGKRVTRYERPVIVDGQRRWLHFEEFDTCDPVVDELLDEPDYFAHIVRSYLASGRGRAGKIGRADSVLVDARDIDAYAVQWLVNRIG